MHRYLVADCVTERCKAKHVLKYVGETGKGTVLDETFTFPQPLVLYCQDCKESHEYHAYHVHPLDMGEPPPSDYQNKI